MNSMARILIAGDLHHQERDRGYLMCSHALRLWREFANPNPKGIPPLCFLQVGDLIDGYELPHDIGRRDLTAAAAELKASSAAAHAIVGNHETFWLPDREFHLRALGVDSISRVVDAGPLRIVLFDVTVHNASHGELTAARAEWLVAAVQAEPAKPAIVIQHQLIHPSDEISEDRYYVRNSGEYRRLLERLPRIQLIITGHRHVPALTLIQAGAGSVPQVTVGAFCSFPFTIGELGIDAVARTMVFRELPLESTFNRDADAEFQALLQRSQRAIVADDPETWTARPRMTPALREIVLRWDAKNNRETFLLAKN